MKRTTKCSGLFLLFLLWLGVAGLHNTQEVQAAGEPYTVDLAPLTPPDFSGFTQIPVNTLAELSNYLTQTATTNVELVLQQDIAMTSPILINGNMTINLNGHRLSASNTAYLRIDNNSTTTKFKIYNGSMSGGPTTNLIGAATSYNNGFFFVHPNVLADIVFEDVHYQSAGAATGSNGGGFFKGLASNVFLLGQVTIESGTYNLRAGNMTFLGNFTGYSYTNGDPGDYAQGYGGVNLSFDGYAQSHRKSAGQVMSQTNGDRRIYIGPNSNVILTNTNTGSSPYANNIGNFSTITIDGKLEAVAYGTSLRTTASNINTQRNYTAQAGTYNGQANINANENSVFMTASTNTAGTFGALYTYNTDVNAYKPRLFDMRYFGRGNFFYAYANAPRSNLRLYDLDIGVWLKDEKGIGNPVKIWQNVQTFDLLGWSIGNPGTLTATPGSLNINLSTFNIDSYSRISNDVALPMIVPDEQFVKANDEVELGNSATQFFGSTNYFLPGNILTGARAANATVTFKVGAKTYTTETDPFGNWAFNNLDLSDIPGGTIATIELVDQDQRIAPVVSVKILDTLAPKAQPKLIKVAQNNLAGLQDPKAGLLSYSDETTPKNQLEVSFVTPVAERTQFVQTLGVHEVEIKVADATGNETIVTAPVLVYPPGETITDGYVFGKDFTIDYNTWVNATEAERIDFILDEDYGDVKGYAINGDTITDVTNDPVRMVITIPTAAWAPNQTYEMTARVNSYTKKIRVTLVPSAVTMTVKQVYAGTDIPIYSNLATKQTVNNTTTYQEEIGDNLTNILTELMNDGDLQLNYEGYDTIQLSDYKVFRNGQEVIPKPTVVPNENFTIVFEYQGQLKFKDTAPDLDFGAVTITDQQTETPLSSSSDTEVSVINTLQNQTWKLNVSLPYGITTTDPNNQRTFLGEIFYKNQAGTEIVIGSTATVIESQNTDDLLNTINLRGDTFGMFLRQNAGNLQGNYEGELLWTLEDSP